MYLYVGVLQGGGLPIHLMMHLIVVSVVHVMSHSGAAIVCLTSPHLLRHAERARLPR